MIYYESDLSTPLLPPREQLPIEYLDYLDLNVDSTNLYYVNQYTDDEILLYAYDNLVYYMDNTTISYEYVIIGSLNEKPLLINLTNNKIYCYVINSNNELKFHVISKDILNFINNNYKSLETIEHESFIGEIIENDNSKKFISLKYKGE